VSKLEYTAWVRDGHFIQWDEGGHYIEHPEHCPYKDSGGLRHYLCNPGIHEDAYGLTADDFQHPGDYDRLSSDFMGSEAFEYRLVTETWASTPDHPFEQETRFDVRLVPVAVASEEERP
jgi:hypothetical protein